MLQQIRRSLHDLALTYDDNSFIFIPVLLLLLIEGLLAYIWSIQLALLAGLPLALLFASALLFHTFRKTETALEEERRQNQALISVHQLLDLRAPLPSMTGWSAYPELSSIIIEYATLLQPSFILEAGSGVSSIVSGYCLEKHGGEGRILSLDHDESYGAKTSEQLSRHGLSAYTRVVHAPLKTYEIDGKKWQWYDLDAYHGNPTVDLLLVDGPPVKTQDSARYPALPLLHEHLSKRAAIILDDAGRDSESGILEQWLDQYPEFSLDFRPGRKGIAILTRNI